MARFLRERDAHSNARLTVEAPGRSFAELASAVNGQLDAAQEERVAARRQQQEFQRDLASLSHDIRTPLMGAKGYLRLAQDVGAGFEGVAEAAGPHVEDAEGTAEAEEQRARAPKTPRPRASAAWPPRRRVLTTCGRFWTSCSPTRRRTTPTSRSICAPSACCPCWPTCWWGSTPPSNGKGGSRAWTFEDEALLVDADPEALARIFENLVVNALRHGVSAPTIEQRGGAVTFANEVSDPAALDVERLFERFYRADASRTSPGSGLGLAVAASLAEAMGMRLDARLEGATLRMGLELWGC